MSGIDPNRLISEQDLKNGMSSVLEFCAEAHRLAGNEKGRDYLLQVSRDITSGKGHPAPNPGPVTPPRDILGVSQPSFGGSYMDDERIKTIVSTGLTLATTLIPGVDEAIHAVGGQDAVVGTVLATWALIHGLVHFVHSRAR